MTHQIVNVVTAFLIGAILMALGLVLLTRTEGCRTDARVPPEGVADALARPPEIQATGRERVVHAQPVPGMDAQEIARIAREAVRRERAAEDERWKAAMCADLHTTLEQRQILGCDRAAR